MGECAVVVFVLMLCGFCLLFLTLIKKISNLYLHRAFHPPTLSPPLQYSLVAAAETDEPVLKVKRPAPANYEAFGHKGMVRRKRPVSSFSPPPMCSLVSCLHFNLNYSSPAILTHPRRIPPLRPVRRVPRRGGGQLICLHDHDAAPGFQWSCPPPG